MAKFSDRQGITRPPTELQVKEINRELRNSLWNLLVTSFEDHWTAVARHFCINYYKDSLEILPKMEFPDLLYAGDSKSREWLHQKFMKTQWHEVYNLVEYVLQNLKELTGHKTKKQEQEFETNLNFLLERELSGYRAIKGAIVPITDEQEVETIRQAASVPSSSGLEAASQHISTALHLLGKKPEPDYRNSIKESISAVESVCKKLTGEKSGGLNKALTELSKKIPIHPSLRNGLSNLYGYTSDEDGIRHAILESTDIGFAEAKFMLVACSAFVNFLIDKAHQAKVL